MLLQGIRLSYGDVGEQELETSVSMGCAAGACTLCRRLSCAGRTAVPIPPERQCYQQKQGALVGQEAS